MSIVDIKAQDSTGAWYIIEIQTTLRTGLRNRLIYYTSGLFYGQMREGGSYGELRPAISICFLTEPLFPTVPTGNLRFSMYDPVHSVSLGDQLQLHLIELSKYDIREDDLSEAERLEKWVFFFTDAHKYDADQLRRLLPEAAYQKATETLEMIAREPDLRLIYDDRANEEKDKFSFLKDARAEGRAEGKAEGRAESKLIGRVQLLQQLLDISEPNEASLSAMDERSLADLANDLYQRLQNRS